MSARKVAQDCDVLAFPKRKRARRKKADINAEVSSAKGELVELWPGALVPDDLPARWRHRLSSETWRGELVGMMMEALLHRASPETLIRVALKVHLCLDDEDL